MDGMEPDLAFETAEVLKKEVWGFKVNDLLDKLGPRECLKELKKYGRVMADPKLCDIPSTMRNRIREYTKAHIITVMAIAGKDSLKAALESVGIKTEIAVVTVLTSINEQECYNLFKRGPSEQAIHLSRLAQETGASYIVCSARELKIIKSYGISIKTIVPGIRPLGISVNDQKRISTPENAVKYGADLLVIGRPITQAKSPLEMAQRINEEIRKTERKFRDEV